MGETLRGCGHQWAGNWKVGQGRSTTRNDQAFLCHMSSVSRQEWGQVGGARLETGLKYILGIKDDIKQVKIKGTKMLMLGNFCSRGSSSLPRV